MSNFPLERQQKLSPLMLSIWALPGIESVRSDDWDSSSIRLHVHLKHPNKYEFHEPLNATTRRISSVCKKSGVGMIITKRPTKSRSYIGFFRGVPEYSDNGYDGFVLSVDVDV